jgi:hypothetical protein
MTRRLLLLCLIVLLIAPAVSAQTAAWEVIAAAESGGTWSLIRITEAGMQPPLSLPAPLFIPGAQVNQIEVSPDLRFAAVSQTSPSDYTPFDLYITDLKSRAVYPVTIPGETQAPAAYAISSFDPTGTRFAVSAIYDMIMTSSAFAGVFGVVDAATGTFTDYTAQVAAAGAESYAPGWYKLGGWDENGVHLHASCYACEPPFEGVYSAWNPDTDAFMSDTGVAFSFFAEQLPMTGELFARSYSTDYPFSTEPAAYFPTPNILVYMPSTAYLPTFGSQSGEHEASAESPVIYNDPNVIDLSGVEFEWVTDGQHILAAGESSWLLLDRAGRMQRLTAFAPAYTIVGTTDGWLSFEQFAGGQSFVRHYTVDGVQAREDQLGVINGSARVLRSTLLGESADPIPAAFTPIQPDFAQLEAIMLANQPICPGFMPSRLFPGQVGRVTPGDPNNLRASAGLTSEIVGRVPGGAAFNILGGPVCAENTAWWYVEYNGTYGYMAEGMGGAYYTELERR